MKRRLAFTLIATVVVTVSLFVGNLIAGNHPSLGLDLQGGASVTLTPKGTFDPAALTVAVDIIRQRVDSIGVAEPEIIRQGNTVVVNLPGVKDQQRALELIGRTGEVDLRPVLKVAQNPNATTSTTVAGGATSTTVKGATTSSTLAGQAGGPGSARVAATTSTTAPSTTTTVKAATSTTVKASSGNATTTTVASSTATTVPGALPPDNKDSQAVLQGRKDGLLYLVGPTSATGEIFNNNATAEISNGAWVVVANLKSGASGEDAWNKLATDCYNGTSTCPSKSIAIVLDGEVISAPVVQTPTFTGGNVQISGNFTETEANDLAKILQFGAVPVQFDAPTVQTVSATLGKDSLHAAIISGLIGVLLVLAFLVFYYRLIALVVVGGLGVSSLLLWSVISWLSKTNGLALTLSGTAGIIVSIGVTVDSYVVFFERLKDDVQHGRSLRNSAVRGFESAWRTILAADTVSLIGALVLWWLTVGSVRGFAFFLGLSTLSDIVVSYFFTRPAVLMLSRTNFMNRGNVLGVARDASKEVAQ